MTVLSVRFDDDLMARLRKKAKELGVEEAELIQKALKDYLYLDQVQEIRAQMQELFNKKGYNSEEEIFDQVS